MVLYLAYVNDLLSFYKEEFKPSDSRNFIHSQARLNGIRPFEPIKRIQVKAIELVRKMRNMIFSDDEAMLNIIERFIHGYVSYHLYSR
jgi:membrane-associated protease RseP (regulator of RpoE activity)